MIQKKFAYTYFWSVEIGRKKITLRRLTYFVSKYLYSNITRPTLY